MKVLVLGATGMLGHKLMAVLGEEPSLEVHGTVRSPDDRTAETLHVVDLDRGSADLAAVLERVRPDVVVNAVGAIKQRDLYGAVDRTFFLNGSLPHLIPLLAPNPLRVVHFSTDCVFRGDRGGYTEDDAPDVEDLYGRSKACGEITYGDHLTIRTSIVGFERRGHLGLLGWLLSQPSGARLKGFRRAIYSGLPTVTLARLVRSLLTAGLPMRGLWHVASQPIDKYELLCRLDEALGLGLHITPDDELIMDRSLDDSRFRQITGTTTPSWDELVADLVTDYHTGGYAGVYQKESA